MKKKIIGVDFDGTCVTNDYPDIGKEIGATPILKRLVAAGHKLVLITNRTNEPLEAAENWFRNNGIPLYGVNNNPSQARWSKSPKIYANYYIDDTAIGCPLITDSVLSKKPYADWKALEALLEENGLL